MKCEFLDYGKSVAEKYCIGYVSMSFRDSNKPDWYNSYVLNSHFDGWFRRPEGPAKGYGLCIDSIKITSRQPVLIGDFLVYKAVCDYTTNYETPATDKFWLFVHRRFELSDVMQYIQDTKDQWYP